MLPFTVLCHGTLYRVSVIIDGLGNESSRTLNSEAIGYRELATRGWIRFGSKFAPVSTTRGLSLNHNFVGTARKISAKTFTGLPPRRSIREREQSGKPQDSRGLQTRRPLKLIVDRDTTDVTRRDWYRGGGRTNAESCQFHRHLIMETLEWLRARFTFPCMCIQLHERSPPTSNLWHPVGPKLRNRGNRYNSSPRTLSASASEGSVSSACMCLTMAVCQFGQDTCCLYLCGPFSQHATVKCERYPIHPVASTLMRRDVNPYRPLMSDRRR